MTILHDLMYQAEQAEKQFDELATQHRFPDRRWGVYRALDRGEKIPSEVMQAYENYFAATRAYYQKRDGYLGFLGSRGV